jgi:hypothetical protein
VLIVAVAWMYVVVMMSVAEAASPQGTVLGAVFTLLLYGVLPLSIVLYIMATPARRKLIKQREQQEWLAAQAAQAGPSGPAPDGGQHAAGDAVAAKGKEA